jgi:hypothetical protein
MSVENKLSKDISGKNRNSMRKYFVLMIWSSWENK